MRVSGARRMWLAVLCAAVASLAITVPAQAATDPLFVFTPTPPPFPVPLRPLPTGYFSGPCGLAVDSAGSFYVSDYYHHAVDVYSGAANYSSPQVNGATGYSTQLANEDPTDGPCGLALSGGKLLVNNYHRNVTAFGASEFSSGGQGAVVDSSQPTGVAVDPTTTYVYVDDRTHISVYDPTGAPVLDGEGHALRIGEGTLGDGYGIAASQFSLTAGRLYVPDAQTNTVKVYDPAVSRTNPVAEIKNPSNKPFTSLRDSAVAVDRVTGDVYIADNAQPEYTERPQATIYVYSSAGAYKGHLKYNVIDSLPPGLAVDNSGNGTQGRVYVTSGNTDKASIYAYSSGAATGSAPLPPIGSGLSAPGSSGGAGPSVVSTPLAAASETAGSSQVTAEASTITQIEDLRISVAGKLSPKRLPREGSAPISVAVGWKIGTTDDGPPPRLKSLKIEINRHGRFDFEGLPTCPIAKIQPATTQRALSNCRAALVGKGSFSAEIALKGQEGESYDTTGKLLVFNGESKGKPVLFGQIYAAHPFATSFVITFAVKNLDSGPFGTALAATLPKALRSWGNLTGIEMTLSKRYGYKGERHSYISAGCPAPKGFGFASFKLARAGFAFNGGKEISSTVTGDCKVRG